MQSLMFPDCFVQKLSKENLWELCSSPPDKGMVKRSLKLQNLATFRLKNTGKPEKERRL